MLGNGSKKSHIPSRTKYGKKHFQSKETYQHVVIANVQSF